MLTIRRRLYTSEHTYQNVFTRIRWDVERVATLVNPMLGNVTVDTRKQWVGKINSSEGTFKITETNSSILPLRFFQGNFFTLFIHGYIFTEEQKTRLDVRFKLGWLATLTFLSVYLSPIILASMLIRADDWDNLKGLTVWLLAFDVIPTLLLLAQLNRIENKILDLLGVE